MIETLGKILPPSVLRALSRQSVARQTPNMPQIELSAEHLAQVQVLPSRLDMLALLPKGGKVAEIGVDRGAFSEEILRINQPQKLHLVDVWGDRKRYHDGLKAEVMRKFQTQMEAGQVSIHIGYSTDVVSEFEDAYFDWIYLDTDHSYATTKAELYRYAPKVKSGGIIAGHDFAKGSWVSMVRYGVREAVYEFCVQEGWQFVYLTMEHGINPSFAIQKIG